MELSNNETFDEASFEPTSDVAPSNGTCRLRHGLNVNCLLKVFDYLELDDLTELCEMDPYFKGLITNRTIKKKMIELPDLYQTRADNPNEDVVFRKADHPELIEMFETYGKSMGKFTIRCEDLSHLLELIVEYCEPNTLTEIDLQVGRLHYLNDVVTLPVDQKLLDLSKPFFSNLRVLIFSEVNEGGNPNESDQKVFHDFLSIILSSAANLQKLVVEGVNVTGGWLQSSNNNLRELRIFVCGKQDTFEDLVSCLKMNSKLKVFKIRGDDNDISTIGDVFSESCTNLECFSDRQDSIPYSRFDSIINRYNFLSTLPHLRRVKLTSNTLCGSDLYNPLKRLAKSKIVELKIYVCIEGAIELEKDVTKEIMSRWLPDLTNIQSVTIYTFIDVNFDFYFHLMKHLKNLKTFKFKTCYPVPDIHKVLEFAPSIETLDLSSYSNMDFDETMKNIVKTLRKIRQLNGDHQHLLHLKLDINYKYEVKEFYADTEDIMKVSYFGNYFLSEEHSDELDEMYN